MRELNASKFSGPAELATVIREMFEIKKDTELWIRNGSARHRITLKSYEAVCRGLLIASEISRR